METFVITVDHNNKQYTIQGSLLQVGYTHKIYIDIEDVQVMLEPDEERNYRAVIDPQLADKVDRQLIATVVAEIEKHVR